MTLLADVIDDATGTTAVSSLLRKVKVLAARTRTPGLAEWVTRELTGYPTADDIPRYRGPFPLAPLATFTGPAGAQINNIELPPSTFPEQLRDSSLFRLWLTQPIAELEAMARDEYTTLNWPPDAVPMYHQLLRAGRITPVVQPFMVLVEVRTAVSAATFIGALDAVRTRVLDLALDIEQVAPGAGQADAAPVIQERAAAVINNHFHAPANVAIASTDVTQSLVVGLPETGDADGLVRYLGAAGLPAEQLMALRAALDADVAEDPVAASRWARTRAWLSGSATDVSTGALGSVIATAGQSFLG